MKQRKKYLDMNASIRENMTPETAKKLFDSASKFTEELNYWINDYIDKDPFLTLDAIILALEKAKLTIYDLDTIKDLRNTGF